MEAKKKTRTVLNRLWLEPRAELVDYVDRGVAIHKAQPDIPVAALCWGTAVATYPFFGKVAELVGRLSAIQGDCASAEVHRRMSETYGEREGTRRMTNMVIQSQASWGAVKRVEKGKRVIRLAPTVIDNDELTAWLIEATVRYSGKPVSLPSLQSLPVLFPFTLSQSLSYLVSNSSSLDLRSEGPSNQFVALRSTI
ncbi:VrlQ protein [Pseudomonas aeruginosa]|nr:VrlQ protein [Pseudomonas aeruginosa]